MWCSSHSYDEPDRFDSGGNRQKEQGLLDGVHYAHRVEARTYRIRVLLLSTSVRFLHATILFGGRVARLSRTHRRHDGFRIPERCPTGRHRGQPDVPVRAQAHADRVLRAGNVRLTVYHHRLHVRIPRHRRPASREFAPRRVPAIRVLRHVRRTAVAMERVRRDVPDGRQGHHEWRALFVWLRAHVRCHQGVSAVGGHIRYPGGVDHVRLFVLHHGPVRGVRFARDHRQDSQRDHRRV